jgi:hypothetical protein
MELHLEDTYTTVDCKEFLRVMQVSLPASEPAGTQSCKWMLALYCSRPILASAGGRQCDMDASCSGHLSQCSAEQQLTHSAVWWRSSTPLISAEESLAKMSRSMRVWTINERDGGLPARSWSASGRSWSLADAAGCPSRSQQLAIGRREGVLVRVVMASMRTSTYACCACGGKNRRARCCSGMFGVRDSLLLELCPPPSACACCVRPVCPHARKHQLHGCATSRCPQEHRWKIEPSRSGNRRESRRL